MVESGRWDDMKVECLVPFIKQHNEKYTARSHYPPLPFKCLSDWDRTGDVLTHNCDL